MQNESQTPDRDFGSLRGRLFEVFEVADNCYVTSHPATEDLSPPRMLVASLLLRCHGLFRSALLLLRDRYAEEAAILSRSLVTDAITLNYMLKEEARLEELSIRFEHRSLTYEKRLAYRTIALGHPDRVAPPAEIDRRISELASHAASLGLHRLRGFPNEDAMAQAIDQNSLPWWIDFASNLVHTTHLGLSWRTSGSSDGGIRLHSRTHNERVFFVVGWITAETFMLAHTSAALLLGWTGAEDIEANRRRLHAQLNKLMAETGFRG